jgi:hypothetical protein
MALSESLSIVLITTVSGVILKLISLCYKSKCKTFYCWGIHIDRDVIIEEEFDEMELNKTMKNGEKDI